MFSITNVSIKRLVLPKLTLPVQQFIRLMRCVGFNRMRDSSQFDIFTRRGQKMNMIRHYHPSRQQIFLFVVKEQTVLRHLCNVLIFQKTTAVTFVQIVLDVFAKDYFAFLTLCRRFLAPFFNHGLGQRIKQTKCEKLRNLAAVEMRNVASVIPTQIRAEPFWLKSVVYWHIHLTRADWSTTTGAQPSRLQSRASEVLIATGTVALQSPRSRREVHTPQQLSEPRV